MIQKLKNFLKRNYCDLDPDRVVSFGAALHGHKLLMANNLLWCYSTIPGIETLGGLMEKIIPEIQNTNN